MDWWTQGLQGKTALIAIIGAMIFIYTFVYSINIFNWVEEQTLGTRTYLLEKFELLFIKVKPEYVTYALLGFAGFMGGGTLILFGILGLWILGIILSLLMTFLAFKIPKPIVDYLVAKRIKLYSSQMVDALTLLSNGIRAGLSVPQALGMIVSELPNPVSQEFNLILKQNRIGTPLDECFENLTKRVPTEDNEMFVSSINILRETGANLSETFDTIVFVIRERVRLKQKIETFTAQGVFQGITIFLMPFGIGGIYFASDPELMFKLFTTAIGWLIVLFALFLDILGGFIILKIVKIKV